MGYYTKSGKNRPIIPPRKVVMDTHLLDKDNRTIGSYEEIRRMPSPKKPWQEEGWRKTLYQHGNYSFDLVKHEGILDYYVAVKKEDEEFCCIFLKPLLARGISHGLQAIGIPIDIDAAVESIERVKSFLESIT